MLKRFQCLTSYRVLSCIRSMATETNVRTPVQLRLDNRENKTFCTPSYGECGGYFQANIAIVHQNYADDFKKFCELNSSACPLVYQSKKGEVEATTIAKHSDIRTDLAAYRVFKNGLFTETVADLSFQAWNDMCTFYLGCSFSFDDKLLQAGVKLDGSSNIIMYLSNIACKPVGLFHANMEVTMRPIPKALLQQTYEATINMDYCHGAPVHIGRPRDIGVELERPDSLGHYANVPDGHVPVFWACGATSGTAIRNAKLSVTYGHYPGNMFVSDTLSDNIPSLVDVKQYPKPLLLCLDETLQRYSVVSKYANDLLTKIEEIIGEDKGDRGINHLIIQNNFHKAILSLSKHAKSVGIILGFSCFQEGFPIEENDGIHGAIIIARALTALGVNVTFFIDTHSTILKETLKDSFAKGYFKTFVPVKTLGEDYNNDINKVLIDDVTGEAQFTHLIAIERPSKSVNGIYPNMRGRDISSNCDPLDQLFELAKTIPDITTIGIGDGGNEVGMGKVLSRVLEHVHLGPVIASSVSCDYLMACGVSDWGGYAIACGLYIVRNCMTHDRYRRYGIKDEEGELDIDELMFNDSQDLEMRKMLIEKGFRDGINGKLELTVDNLDYFEVHLPKIQIMRSTALDIIQKDDKKNF